MSTAHVPTNSRTKRAERSKLHDATRPTSQHSAESGFKLKHEKAVTIQIMRQSGNTYMNVNVNVNA